MLLKAFTHELQADGTDYNMVVNGDIISVMTPAGKVLATFADDGEMVIKAAPTKADK